MSVPNASPHVNAPLPGSRNPDAEMMIGIINQNLVLLRTGLFEKPIAATESVTIPPKNVFRCCSIGFRMSHLNLLYAGLGNNIFMRFLHVGVDNSISPLPRFVTLSLDLSKKAYCGFLISALLVFPRA